MLGPSKGRMWLATACAVVLMTALTCPVQAAKPTPIDATGVYLNVTSYREFCPSSQSYFHVGYPSDLDHTGDISLGVFGADGKVVGGEAALAWAVDIGSAPVSRIDFPTVIDDKTGSVGMYVSTKRRTATGVLDVGAGANWYTEPYMGGLYGYVTTVTEGSGTAIVRLALLTHKGQSWKTAPGMTLDRVVTVAAADSPFVCSSSIGPTGPHAFTIGGGYSRSK